jgi:hypothetical protein
MKQHIPAEILINSTRVTNGEFAEIYEFVLNEELRVIECVRVESLAEGLVFAVDDFLTHLDGVLFELNHVRVNPRVDNSKIVAALTKALTNIGVGVTHPPAPDSIAVCFKPLGEITENVRFHFNQSGQFTFLAPKAKLSVVSNNNKPKSLPNSYYE